MGSRNSFLIQALESGGKTKDAIKSDFLHAYPDSAGKSTFSVFFTDLVRPFGSASVSRSVRIEIDEQGYLSLDMPRAAQVKAAVARGLLEDLSKINRNIYPKKDTAAIEQILRNYQITRK